jgi:transcriptional regulator with XRE-family HTH domain
MYPNLKLQIWRLGVRQNRLAQMIGIDESLLSRIVNGFRQPDAECRVRIAEALHMDEEWLFASNDSVMPGLETPPLAERKKTRLQVPAPVRSRARGRNAKAERQLP